MKPAVLVVNGNDDILSQIERSLASQYRVFKAKTLEEVNDISEENKRKINAILLSRFLNKREKTDKLILSIRKSGLFGKIIALWDDENDLREQMKLGCIYEISTTNPSLTVIRLNKILRR